MPIVFRDYFSFPFNGGRGVRTTQLDGDIRQGQLHEDAGMPTYLGRNAAYDTATSVITLDITELGTDEPPAPCLIYFALPDVIGREDVNLRLSPNGRERVLQEIVSVTALTKARDLTPGALLSVVAQPGAAGRYVIIEPLPVRPQDFDLAVGWIHLRNAPPLDEEIAALIGVTVPRFRSQDFNVPAHPADPNTRDYIWVGVPDDTPNIDIVRRPGTRGLPMVQIDTSVLGNPMFNGVQYKWLRTGSTVALTDLYTYHVSYLPYE